MSKELVDLTGLVKQVSERIEFTKKKGRDAGKPGSVQNIVVEIGNVSHKIAIWDRTDMNFISGKTHTFTALKPQTDGGYWTSYKTEITEVIDSHKLYEEDDKEMWNEINDPTKTHLSQKTVEKIRKTGTQLTPPITDNITPEPITELLTHIRELLMDIVNELRKINR